MYSVASPKRYMENFSGLGLYHNNWFNKVVISAEKLMIITVVMLLTVLNIPFLNESELGSV